MAWFLRQTKGILTDTKNKKEAPDGVFYKTPKGNIVYIKDIIDNAYVCPEDGYHMRIGSKAYFKILFDLNNFTEINTPFLAKDILAFTDKKAYASRLNDARKKTGLKDAIRTAYGKMNGLDIMIACMDFAFIGGSMGTIVGEKIAKAVDFCLEKKMPLLIISKSGGARMMEGSFSLMQMAKTAAKLLCLAQAKIPYISLMTDPTTGGVTASFAMLGDFNIAEPDALIGFGGPRVIKETIGRELPKGFQKSEFLLENGFLDFIVDRRYLKTKLTTLLKMLSKE